jgi:hypothetical protein
MKTRGDKWTENEISLAKDLYIKGISLSEISKQVNHSVGAITKKIQELGLSNRRIDWTDEDIQKLKELYENGYTYPEIAFELGKTTRGCQAKAIRLGLKKKECNVWLNNSRSDFWTKEDVDKLLDCADNYSSYEEISKIINRSIKAISCKLHELNKHIKEKTDIEESLYRRAYSVDDNYFENVDSQKKAYWLGWLVTDGYVLTKFNTKRGIINSYSIGLDLAEKDLYVLEDFKKDIKANISIKYVKEYTPKAAYKNKITGKERVIKGGPQYSLRFSSAKMIQDLAKYGIHQNKTYDVVFPKELDSKYYPGFIAGVISGDGCIDIKKNHNKGFILRCTIAGNLDLVQKIREILIKEICFNPEKKISKYESSKCLYRLELNQTETIALYYWLQKNGISLMERKNKLIEEFINERVKIPA